MVMGRPSKPTAIKVIEGNPGKRPINDREAKPTRGIPDPPSDLDADGLAEWQRVAPELERAGLLSKIDRMALAAYCDACARWVQARRLIREEAARNPTYEGLIIQGAHGGWVQNPALVVANKAMSDVIRYCAEFGMTPSARSRIAATPRTPEEDPAAEFIN